MVNTTYRSIIVPIKGRVGSHGEEIQYFIVIDIMIEGMLTVASRGITACPGAYPAVAVSYGVIVNRYILLYVTTRYQVAEYRPDMLIDSAVVYRDAANQGYRR